MRNGQPAQFQQPLGRPLEHVGDGAGSRLRRLELGANHAGEIAALAEICRPKVGVITQIGDAHLAGFGNRRNSPGKSELLAALPPDGHAVLGDDTWLRNVAADCPVGITWVGAGSHAM